MLSCVRPAAPDHEVFESPRLEHQAVAITDWLWTWEHCVAQQAKRVLNPAPDDLPDGDVYLFVIALRQMLRTVTWAEEMTGARQPGEPPSQRKKRVAQTKAIQSARADFEKAVPGLRDARNIIEHFDAYERGDGDAQRVARDAARQAMQRAKENQVDGWPLLPPLRSWPTLHAYRIKRSAEDYAIVLDNHEVDVRSGVDASQPFVQAVLDALDRWKWIVFPPTPVRPANNTTGEDDGR